MEHPSQNIVQHKSSSYERTPNLFLTDGTLPITSQERSLTDGLRLT